MEEIEIELVIIKVIKEKTVFDKISMEQIIKERDEYAKKYPDFEVSWRVKK